MRLFACAFTLSLLALPLVAAEETALDRYVAQPDEVYKWERVHIADEDGYTFHVLDLTSQKWRSEAEVDRPVWTHWLTVVVPDEVAHETAMLYIGGGDNEDPAPEKASDRTVPLALNTKSIVAELGMVPNQPLHFADSRKHPRYEDDFIAYTRVKYMITGDETWLARLPMVKSAVRAMDALQEFLATEEGGGHDVESFVVAGGSKRGWTTWLTPVVDERVKAIAPLVIDALNTDAITRHHYAAYGFFSPALGDYFRHSLYPYKIGSPDYEAILNIEDPYEYFDRASMELPKYVINATGDQYFLPDNAQFYWDEMPAPKYLRYVPNAKHNLAGSDARESLLAFYDAQLRGAKLPQVTWTISKNGTITVKSDQEPVEVLQWQAHNPDARDFRLDTIGAAWTSEPVEESDGVYRAQLPRPKEGFAAHLIELTFDVGAPTPLKLTSEVVVLPDVLPFKDDLRDKFGIE